MLSSDGSRPIETHSRCGYSAWLASFGKGEVDQPIAQDLRMDWWEYIFLALALFNVGRFAYAKLRSDQLSTLSQQVGEFLGAGKYAEANEIAKRALASAERQFGPDHPAFSTFLNNLGEH